MKSFIIDCLGAIAIVVVASLAIPLYTDHQARKETEGWLAQLQPTQEAIARKALQRGQLQGSGEGVALPRFESTRPAILRIDTDGQILLKGELSGQVVLLMPMLQGRQVSWTCVGGPDNAMPEACHRTLPPT